MTDRLYAVAVSGLVSGPFVIYKHPHVGFVLIHLPSQARIIDLEMQNACKDRGGEVRRPGPQLVDLHPGVGLSARTSKRCGTSTSA